MDISSDDVTIPITTLVANEPVMHVRSMPTPAWNAPFLELLRLFKVIDPSQPSSRLGGQSLCFQPSRDFTEIARIFVSVITPSSLQYEIDLKTIRFSGSDDVPPAVTKLLEYADLVLQRTKRLKESLLHISRVDATSFLEVDLLTCPLCLNPLVSCHECDTVVACTIKTCPASFVLACQQCFRHNRMVCQSCLTTNDTVPIICCSECQSWCCREDSLWCAGRVVKPTVGSAEFAELSKESDWDSETIVRSHPPKPSPCPHCFDHGTGSRWGRCYNIVEDREPHRCPALTPFMAENHLAAATCPECLEQSPGRHCACEINWLCGTCFEGGNKALSYPCFIACPRCGVSYCTSINFCKDYIDFCRGCRGVTLCKDCQEEEATPEDVPTTGDDRPRQIEFAARCNYCEAWSCAECYASDRSAVCYFCDQWFCYECLTDEETHVIERCPICCGYVCADCKVHHLACPGAMTLKSVIPHYLGHFQV